METSNTYALEVTGTSKVCPIGEKVGRENIEGSRTPVLSCEGACIRGEIARLAANIVAKEAPFRRGCHGDGKRKCNIGRWGRKGCLKDEKELCEV